MQTDYRQYAVAWVPQPGTQLAEFGAIWTGWNEHDPDPYAPRVRSNTFGLSGTHSEIARRGLHGQISTPFRLAPGRSFWRLDEALADMAETMPAVQLAGFDVAQRDDRAVLVPRRGNGAVTRLQGVVADAVHLVSTRPGRSASEAWLWSCGTALPLGLLPGAPLIPDFQVPLTDRLPGGQARAVVASLRPRIAGLVAAPQCLCDIALMGDPGGNRRWRLLQRYPLAKVGLGKFPRITEALACRDEQAVPPIETVMGSSWETVIA